MYSKRSISSLVGLIALVSTSSWLSIQSQKTDAPPPTPTMINTIVHQAHFIKMHPTGLPQYEANIGKIERQRNGDSFLYAVHAMAYPNNAKLPIWHLEAKKGHMHDSTKAIRLWQDVAVYRGSNRYAIPLKLTTNTLNIDPNQQIASTDDAVTIYQPGTANVTTGVGLFADLKKHMIKLLSNVHSTYNTKASYDASSS